MKKTCKLVRINDGSAKNVLVNGDFHLVEEYTWAQKYLRDHYLAKGYVIRQMVTEVTPAIQEDGEFTFFRSGFTFYMEREEEDCEPEDYVPEDMVFLECTSDELNDLFDDQSAGFSFWEDESVDGESSIPA